MRGWRSWRFIAVALACVIVGAAAWRLWRAPPPHGPPAGCAPYWKLVELGCDPTAISQAGLSDRTYCEPVTDGVTQFALRSARLATDAPTDPVVREYALGALWTDDPDLLLLDEKGQATQGLRWCQAFKAAAAESPPVSLLARSHFGDLQVLHGMATHPGETVVDTAHATRPLVEFLYRVAAGEIPGTTRLGDVAVEGFPSSLRIQKTVDELFGVKGAGDVKARAMGALLHYIHDSLGDGHAERNGGARPLVSHYFTYANGVHALHKADAGWRAVWASGASVNRWPGSTRAIRASIDLVRLVQHKQPWPVAQHYISDLEWDYAGPPGVAVVWAPGLPRQSRD